jgi:hypothetical protein
VKLNMAFGFLGFLLAKPTAAKDGSESDDVIVILKDRTDLEDKPDVISKDKSKDAPTR